MAWGQDRKRAFDFTIYSCVLLSGTLTMSLEMLIGRSLTPYLGGTIYTWGALIAVFLIGMTFGFLVGGRLADRLGSLNFIALLFVAAAGLIAVIPLTNDAVINNILDRVDDMRAAALLSCMTYAFAPAFVLAAISPCGLRLVIVSSEKSGTVSGHISALNTLGSIGGTLLTSFYLIPTIGTQAIYFGLCASSLAAGVLLFALHMVLRRKTRMEGFPSFAWLALFAVMAGFVASAASSPVHAQTKPPFRLVKEGLVEKDESEYNTIFVERHNNLLYMAFGYRRNRYVESILDLDDLGALPVVYTRYMSLAAAYVPQEISRIAMVGLGGGRTISYLVDALQGAVADVAELDGSVIRLAKTYFNVAESDRLHIFNRDGRVFLAQSKEQYDLVLVDAYRGPFVPFHLTTVEFYKLAKAHLKAGGVLAQNVEPTTLMFDSTYATLKAAFDNVDAYEAEGNVVLVAYDGPAKSDEALMAQAFKLQSKYKFRYALTSMLSIRKTSVPVSGAKVLTDDFAPVEMLKTIERHNQRKPE